MTTIHVRGDTDNALCGASGRLTDNPDEANCNKCVDEVERRVDGFLEVLGKRLNYQPDLGFQGRLWFCSNFAPSPMAYRGYHCPTAEHAFQLCKTTDPQQRAHVAAAKTPGDAKRRGRQVDLRSGWERMKRDRMRSVVRAKFRQNPDLLEQLVATAGVELVEHNSWGDTTWGKVNGRGDNWLGQILMDLRQETLDNGGSLRF